MTSRSYAYDAALRQAGLDVVRGTPAHDLDELRPALAAAVAWIAGTGPVTDAHLAAAPALRVLARYGVGVDAVDLGAAARRGVAVTNTPGANADAVADLAVALLLAALRGVVPGDRGVRAGDWRTRRGRELGPLTVGLVGYGRIGRGVARRLAGFGTRVLAYDPYAADAGSGMDELLRASDAISLHAPGGVRIVDGAWLRRVRPGAVLVNTARADLVDEDAVAAALRDGRLAAYAADTLTGENGAHTGPLLAADLADRVIVTPHVGAQTAESVERMGRAATDAVLDVLAGRDPAHPVTARGTDDAARAGR